MAGLLFKKVFITLFFLAIFCLSGECFESSFPFPFEFGHSSDIYLDVKKPETKETRQKAQIANDIIVQKGISKEPKHFIQYIKNNDIETVKLLLDAGFNPNTSINANYPIYYAVKYKRYEILKLLIEYGAELKIEVCAPLRMAIQHHDYKSAKLLIENGADVNYYDGILDEYVLYTAIKEKEYGLARLMIEKGAKIDPKSYSAIKKKKLERVMGLDIDRLLY